MHAHKLATYAQLFFSKEKAERLIQRRNDKTVLELAAKVLSFIECPYKEMNGQKDCVLCHKFFEGVNVPCEARK